MGMRSGNKKETRKKKRTLQTDNINRPWTEDQDELCSEREDLRTMLKQNQFCGLQYDNFPGKLHWVQTTPKYMGIFHFLEFSSFLLSPLPSGASLSMSENSISMVFGNLERRYLLGSTVTLQRDYFLKIWCQDSEITGTSW